VPIKHCYTTDGKHRGKIGAAELQRVPAAMSFGRAAGLHSRSDEKALVSATTTGTGVLICTYRPAGR
jgi:hypothetical protein